MNDNRFGFGEVRRKIIAMKEDLPVVLANQAQNYFVKSWRDQGWEGQTWETPQRKIEGTWSYKSATKAARTRATLVQSGALRRAVGNSIRSKRFDNIKLVVAIPYAAIHNDGGTINKGARDSVVHFNKKGKFAKAKYNNDYSHSANVTIGAHDITMPARTFMKDSATLRRMQVAKINEFTNKIWR